MSEPDISTLARRLAEQNNVDWRVLRGSGPDGKVVERDVLDFLAKVMAGEEAINPTPEPVPEGMEAWPDQDIQGFRAGLGEAATLGALRDELGEASRDYFAEPGADDVVDDGFAAAEAGAGVSEAHVFGGSSADDLGAAATAEQDGQEGIDEDIFLFEDEPAVAVEQPQAPSFVSADSAPAGLAAVDAASQGAFQAADDLDELLVAGDDFEAAGASNDVDTYAASTQDSRFGGVPAGYLGSDDQGAGPAGEGDLDDVDGGLGSGASFTTEVVEEAPFSATAGSAWGDEISFGDDSRPAHQQGAAVPDLWGQEVSAQSDDSELWTGPTGATIEAFTDSPDVGTTAAETTWSDGGAGASSASGEHTASGDGFGEQADTGAAADSGFAEGVGSGLAAVGATLLTAGAATLPLARPGTILRRNIDVSALAAAQLAVGQELGFDEPLGASAFLLRAVVKAASSTGYSTGAVGLAVLEEGVTIRRVDAAADMSFTELVQVVGKVDQVEDEPVLVAADLSGLDVDEAVLELSTPVISLGRILYDNQRGAYRSTLSLTGPMPLDTAAALLARVAELLDAPVRLVL